ncbi:pyrroloquinoline quinone biosynthesis protein PqqF, partial [Erwinia oleae]|uniref:pyrroloquinoline quinone biosynthesis protein PqqF n=1 Tax=Erwinia oleae TaxID=796334 RepID=UPI0009079E08
MEAERRVLANGLRIALIHDPDASQAAALFHLDAGSLHEPDAWPGLAHLLEHVLFAGSEGFPGEARLMAWAPAEGALLNATTQANATAWFVGMAADKLPEALARLADMLARPLLTIDAVRQEANVIEAEYRLLAQHAGAQCEAALSHAFAAPHPFQRFQIGSRECYGEDAIALQQALKAYHQRFFHAGNLTLWLQGPQSVEELAALAAHAGSGFRAAVHPATPPPALKAGAQRTFAMQSSRLRLLQIGFLVSACHADSFALLETLLCDPAPDTLLNRLRREELCDEVKLLEPYRSPSQSLLLVEFQLCETASAGRIEALLRRWLAQLDALSDATLGHYAALARQRFRRRSPLDQLRARAFGFPPASTQGFAGLRAQLRPADAVSLHIAPEIVAEKVWLRGFQLRFTPTHREEVTLFP